MLGRELAGRHLTRKELLPLLPATGHPRHNEVVTHLLLIAVDVWLASGARAGDAEGAGTAADRLGQHLGLDALTTVHVGP